MATTPSPERRVGALGAGIDILRYLAATSGAYGVTRIAKDLEINPSTCFNLLKTLVHERLVTFDQSTKTYRLGLGMVELAKGALNKASFTRLMRPHLEKLAEHHSITATLWQRTSDERVVLVDLAENNATLRIHMSIGQRLPMYIAALGRCMAAHSDLSPLELRQKIRVLRWDHSPEFESYLQEVESVRRNGFAIDRENFVHGIVTVSSPVLDQDAKPVMAVSAVGLAAQLKGNALKILCHDLREHCREATMAMSGGAIRKLWDGNVPAIESPETA